VRSWGDMKISLRDTRGGPAQLGSVQLNRKRKVVMAIFALTFVIVIIGISYAFVKFTLFGNKKQVITSGNLSLLITNEVELNLSDAYPVADEVGMIGTPASFDLVNKTSTDTNYQLYLEDITDNTLKKLDYDIVKIYVEKD